MGNVVKKVKKTKAVIKTKPKPAQNALKKKVLPGASKQRQSFFAMVRSLIWAKPTALIALFTVMLLAFFSTMRDSFFGPYEEAFLTFIKAPFYRINISNLS